MRRCPAVGGLRDDLTFLVGLQKDSAGQIALLQTDNARITWSIGGWDQCQRRVKEPPWTVKRDLVCCEGCLWDIRRDTDFPQNRAATEKLNVLAVNCSKRVAAPSRGRPRPAQPLPGRDAGRGPRLAYRA